MTVYGGSVDPDLYPWKQWHIRVPKQEEFRVADYDRFRSFAERYVIERANGFRKGFEREDAWEATLDARTMFNNIGRVSKDMDDPYQELAAQHNAGAVGQRAVQNAIQTPQYATPAKPPLAQGPAPTVVAPGMIGAAWGALVQRFPNGITPIGVDRGRQKSWRK